MEQWKKDTSELDIDDIVKEFSGSAPDDESFEQEFGESIEDDVLVWDGKPARREHIPPAMPQDTVRLGEITKAVKEQTVAEDQTIAFTPVGQEEEPVQSVYVPPEEPKTEPYSEQWEPEYEDPMGEYVPPEPIVFRPKSRLRELKKKLIAGPEKRYYQLAVTVDDGESGVTEVVRGWDLLGSAPRQMYLQELFGFEHPEYAHIPMLMAPEGRRLSKRDQDLDMGALRNRLTPEQLIGVLAHAAGLTETAHPISAKELATVFDWNKIQGKEIVVTELGKLYQ